MVMRSLPVGLELMSQLMPDNYRNIEIMLDYDAGKAVTLGQLTPEWWI